LSGSYGRRLRPRILGLQGAADMVSTERWRKAQEYERSYWEGQARRIAEKAGGALDFYQWRAGELVRRLREEGQEGLADGTRTVVEIGAGPVGVAGFFPAHRRIAVDPLEGFYRTNEMLAQKRVPDVDYREGVGESLPVEDASADLVLIENCIDHTKDVDAVMREIIRVLRPGGMMYLTVNCRIAPGFVVHRTLSRLAVDAGHPHTFTAGKARALVDTRPQLRMVRFEQGSFLEAFKQDLGGSARDRVKAVLGVSEFVVSLLAERVGD
jgi:SAM-dependent methyltransferase